MNWYETVFEVIDMRSFSNLWYWIGLAVLWSSVSHWVMGVPFDMILRARRLKDGPHMDDLEDLARVSVNRILFISDVAGIWIALFGSAFLTALTIVAFGYGIEFAQALLFLVLPLSILALLSVRTAHLIRKGQDKGDLLIKRLLRHRLTTLLIGVVSIFVTAMYGMYTNLYVGPLQ